MTNDIRKELMAVTTMEEVRMMTTVVMVVMVMVVMVVVVVVVVMVVMVMVVVTVMVVVMVTHCKKYYLSSFYQIPPNIPIQTSNISCMNYSKDSSLVPLHLLNFSFNPTV